MKKHIIPFIILNVLYVVGLPLFYRFDIIDNDSVVSILFGLFAIMSTIYVLIMFRNNKSSSYLYIIGYLIWCITLAIVILPIVSLIP